MNKILNFEHNLFEMIQTEWIKVRHSVVWSAVLLIPLISVLIGSGSFYVNKDLFSGNLWFEFWTQIALFYGYFLYPLLIAIIAAYLWRLEHLENNWNMIRTYPVNGPSIWFSKLIILYMFALIAQTLMVVFYFLAGHFLLKINSPVINYFWWWLLAGPFCVMAPGSISLLIALRTRSFSFPIAIAFILCFFGLFCYAQGWWFFPNTLAIIGINAQHEGIPTLKEIIEVFSGTVFWITLSSLIGIYWLDHREF